MSHRKQAQDFARTHDIAAAAGPESWRWMECLSLFSAEAVEQWFNQNSLRCFLQNFYDTFFGVGIKLKILHLHILILQPQWLASWPNMLVLNNFVVTRGIKLWSEYTPSLICLSQNQCGYGIFLLQHSKLYTWMRTWRCFWSTKTKLFFN